MGDKNISSAFTQPTIDTAGDPATASSRENVMQGLNTASGAIKVFGSLIGGHTLSKNYQGTAKALEDYYDYRAQVAVSNAALKEDIVRNKGAKELGLYVATAGKRGLQMTGSVLDAYADRSASIELEAIMTQIEGEQTGRALKYQAAAESYALKQKAGTATGQSLIDSASSAISTATTAAKIAGMFA